MAHERIDINKVVKEQVELIKTEEIIKKILERINSQINQLCVSFCWLRNMWLIRGRNRD